MAETILIVDDDRSSAGVVRAALIESGYKVTYLEDANAAYAFLKQSRVDLLILDHNMPGISGMKLLEIIKQEPKTASLPVIMLTVKGDESYKVKGLNTGADDYIVKPVPIAELVARVQALLRRTQNAGRTQNILEGGGIRVDLDLIKVTVAGKPAALTAAEFELLALFMRRKGHVITYSMIRENLSKAYEDVALSSIYQHVKNLREKLGKAGDHIETLYRLGYRFSAD